MSFRVLGFWISISAHGSVRWCVMIMWGGDNPDFSGAGTLPDQARTTRLHLQGFRVEGFGFWALGLGF